MVNKRLLSLDAFRGFTIAGMILVNNPGNWGEIYPQLKHASWHGWTFTDTIFPFFLFIVGVSIVFSLSKIKDEEKANIYKKILKRTVLIYFFGFLLAGFPYFNLSKIRLVGVLQRISICYFFTSIIYLNSKKINTKIFWILFLLIFYWLAMEFFSIPGIGAGFYEVNKNFSNWLDSKILIGHMWSQTKTWDPEGIFSTLPAIATTLFGVLTGEFLKTNKSDLQKSTYMFFAGQILVFAGMIFGEFMPINKNLWTSSYSVLMAGWALVTLAIFYFFIDVKNYKKIATPFVIFGLNPLTIFVLSGLLARTMSLIKIENSEGKIISIREIIYQNYFVPIASPINSSLLWAIMFLCLMFLIAWGMWKKNIILKI